MTIKELIENGKGYLELNGNKIDLGNPQFKDIMKWNENIANGYVEDGVAYNQNGTKLAWNWVSLVEEFNEEDLQEVANEIVEEEKKEDDLIEKIVEEEVDSVEGQLEEVAEEVEEKIVEDIVNDNKGKNKTK